MSKLLVVFGATGNQGGSIINFVLTHADLSKQFQIRGITRDNTKPASQTLQAKGVEMVNCNLGDKSSIQASLEGAPTVFALTTGDYDTNSYDYELNQGKTIADAAHAVKATYLIYSTLPNITKHTNGKLTHARQFDVKADIESYIRTLPIKSAFYSPGSFMQNAQTIYNPRPQPDGTYAIPSIEPADSKHMPLIDITDTGKYIGAILADPATYEGKVHYGAQGLYSWNEIAEAFSKATGKTVRHKLMPESVFRGFVNLVRGDELCDMFNNRAVYGYHGPGHVEHTRWSNEQVLGRLPTLEEYLARSPIEI